MTPVYPVCGKKNIWFAITTLVTRDLSAPATNNGEVAGQYSELPPMAGMSIFSKVNLPIPRLSLPFLSLFASLVFILSTRSQNPFTIQSQLYEKRLEEPMKPQIILHLKMDSFYASMEMQVNPELRNKPVVIGADPKQAGVFFSTYSYEARAFGIRSAMPFSQALVSVLMLFIVLPILRSN